jgi:hypothetical protein
MPGAPAGTTATESPSAAPRSGETATLGASDVVSHGRVLNNPRAPSISVKASSENTASLGNPPLTDDPEAINGRYR